METYEFGFTFSGTDQQANVLHTFMEKEGYAPLKMERLKIIGEHHTIEAVQLPENKLVTAYFDGNGNATNGKPGLAQYRIYWHDGGITPGSRAFEGKTSNHLEYMGLITLLSTLREVGEVESISLKCTKSCDLVIMGDSALVVNQVNGTWRVKEQALVPLRDQALVQLAEVRKLYKSVELKWIPSKENKVDAHA